MDMDQLHALIYEALETEIGGVLVYQTALECVTNELLIDELEKYLSQTENHVDILVRVISRLGLNPDQETPGRTVVRHAGESLVMTMRIAAAAGKPAAAEIVAMKCVVQAETMDHMNWELIGVAAEALTGTIQKILKEAYDEVEDEEDEHLYHSTGWARELHLQALGLQAQLPPAEEEQDVKTESEAATVRKQRKASLGAGKKKGAGK